ncbi:hypothetical protein HK104_007955, partial [Borealophlyctis nickersoniae]
QLRPVAFEIPLDDDFLSHPKKQASTTEVRIASGGGSHPTLPGSTIEAKSPPASAKLPKLALSESDIKAKLANTEARWKDLENELATRRSTSSLRSRRSKPKLTTTTITTTTTSPTDQDETTTLKQRLLEKDAQAAQNRAKELSKLQAKLARQEERAKRVLERKRAMGRNASSEEMRLSWGGEAGLGLMGGTSNSNVDEDGFAAPGSVGVSVASLEFKHHDGLK